jgi:5'-3' exonuclease
MEKEYYFEEAIYEYIKNHQSENLDMVDITIYFKLSADIIGKGLSILEESNRIIRENYFGCKYRYVIA